MKWNRRHFSTLKTICHKLIYIIPLGDLYAHMHFWCIVDDIKPYSFKGCTYVENVRRQLIIIFVIVMMEKWLKLRIQVLLLDWITTKVCFHDNISLFGHSLAYFNWSSFRRNGKMIEINIFFPPWMLYIKAYINVWYLLNGRQVYIVQ